MIIRKYTYVTNWSNFMNGAEPLFITVAHSESDPRPYYAVRDFVFEKNDVNISECCLLLVEKEIIENSKIKIYLEEGYFNISEADAKRLGNKYYKYYK